MKHLLFSFLIVLLLCSSAFAVGTVTISSNTYRPGGSGDLEKILISWVGDAADGTVPSTDFSFCGTLQRVAINPGATAPTNLYDVVLTDEDSFDLLLGVGTDLLTATSESKIPTKAGSVANTWELMTYCGLATFTLTGNSVHSATGTMTLFLR